MWIAIGFHFAEFGLRFALSLSTVLSKESFQVCIIPKFDLWPLWAELGQIGACYSKAG